MDYRRRGVPRYIEKLNSAAVGNASTNPHLGNARLHRTVDVDIVHAAIKGKRGAVTTGNHPRGLEGAYYQNLNPRGDSQSFARIPTEQRPTIHISLRPGGPMRRVLLWSRHVGQDAGHRAEEE